jgi:hypothetical protein
MLDKSALVTGIHISIISNNVLLPYHVDCVATKYTLAEESAFQARNYSAERFLHGGAVKSNFKDRDGS